MPTGLVESHKPRLDLLLKIRLDTTRIRHIDFERRYDAQKSLLVYSFGTPVLRLQTDKHADYDNDEFEKYCGPVL